MQWPDLNAAQAGQRVLAGRQAVHRACGRRPTCPGCLTLISQLVHPQAQLSPAPTARPRRTRVQHDQRAAALVVQFAQRELALQGRTKRGASGVLVTEGMRRVTNGPAGHAGLAGCRHDWCSHADGSAERGRQTAQGMPAPTLCLSALGSKVASVSAPLLLAACVSGVAPYFCGRAGGRAKSTEAGSSTASCQQGLVHTSP